MGPSPNCKRWRRNEVIQGPESCRYYDIVSWDPIGARVGVNTTCVSPFPTTHTPFAYSFIQPRRDQSVQLFPRIRLVLDRNVGLSPTVRRQSRFLDSLYVLVFQSRAPVMERKLRLKAACLNRPNGQYLHYACTTAPIRGLISITEAFDDAGCDANCYGVSYDTTIGNRFVRSLPRTLVSSVFPDRAGRVRLESSLKFRGGGASLNWQGYFGRCGRSRHSPNRPSHLSYVDHVGSTNEKYSSGLC